MGWAGTLLAACLERISGLTFALDAAGSRPPVPAPLQATESAPPAGEANAQVRLPPSPVASLCTQAGEAAGSWGDQVVVPEIGWAPKDRKVAVLVRASAAASPPKFVVASANDVVLEGQSVPVASRWQSQRYLVDLSALTTPGRYMLRVDGGYAACVEVASDVYLNLRTTGTSVALADVLGSFFALGQRCDIPRDVPANHVDDVNLPRTVYDLKGNESLVDGTVADARGGWHDATSTDKETGTVAGATLHLSWAAARAVLPTDRRALTDEVAWGATYLLKLQGVDGSLPNSVQPPNPYDPASLPRRVVTSFDTGVTARATAALAAASAVLAAEDPALAARALAGARAGWGYLVANPNNFLTDQTRLIDFLGSAGSVLAAAVELTLAADGLGLDGWIKDTLMAGTFVDGVWTGSPTPFAGQISASAPQNERAGALMAMLRYLPRADAATGAHIRAQALAWRDFWRGRLDEAFGVVTTMVVAWAGGDGQQMFIAEGMLTLAEALGDDLARQVAQDQLAWVTGRNPYGASFVFGVGQRAAVPLYARAPEVSLGALLPGIMTTADGSALTLATESTADTWRVGEASLETTAAMVHLLALLHQLQS